jgi:hypothetical protein
MARSGQGAGEPPQAIVAEGSSSPAPRPGASGLHTKTAWGLVGLGLVGHMLRSPRFYETVAVTAIAVGSVRQIGQQNQASTTARLAAWNKREMQRLERKAKREMQRLERKAKREMQRLERKAKREVERLERKAQRLERKAQRQARAVIKGAAEMALSGPPRGLAGTSHET